MSEIVSNFMQTQVTISESKMGYRQSESDFHQADHRNILRQDYPSPSPGADPGFLKGGGGDPPKSGAESGRCDESQMPEAPVGVLGSFPRIFFILRTLRCVFLVSDAQTF